jgi:hypothetical protein
MARAIIIDLAELPRWPVRLLGAVGAILFSVLTSCQRTEEKGLMSEPMLSAVVALRILERIWDCQQTDGRLYVDILSRRENLGIESL